MKKISIGIIIGALLGMLISSYFVNDYTFEKVIYTKITLSTLLVGLFCGSFANLHLKPFNLFMGCLVIGIVVFYAKFLITGHHFDPVNMGTFTGAMIGSIFYVMEKIKLHNRPDFEV